MRPFNFYLIVAHLVILQLCCYHGHVVLQICHDGQLQESPDLWTTPASLRAHQSNFVESELKSKMRDNFYKFQFKKFTWPDLNEKNETLRENENKFKIIHVTGFRPGQIDHGALEYSDESAVLAATIRHKNYLTPRGFLKIGDSLTSSATFLNPRHYCIFNITEDEMEVQVKWPPRIIPKCCPPGFVFQVNLSASDETEAFFGCVETSVEWEPFIYDHISDQQPRPNSMTFDFRSRFDWRGQCINFTRFIIPRTLPPLPSATTNSSAYRRRQIRLVGGQVMTRISGNHNWNREPKKPKENFCMDGLWDVGNSSEYELNEDNQILITCKPHTDRTGIRRVYIYVVLAAAFFLLLIVIVYGLIWSQLTVHGWTVTFFALSMCLWFLFYAAGLGVNLRGGPPLAETPFCVSLGVLVHFFHLSTFTWMTVMNFDLWSSITSLTIRPTSAAYKWNRFLTYVTFAFGIPTVVVSVAITIEAAFGRFEEGVIRPQYGQWRCVVDDSAYLYYVLCIDLFMISLNLLLALSTGRHMWAFKKRTKRVHGAKSEIDLFKRLFVILGFCWILDIVTFWVDDINMSWFQVVGNMANILQAVAFAWVFLSKKDIRDKLRTKFRPPDSAPQSGTQFTT